MASDTLKRLEEIEAALSGFKRRVNYDDIGWLCARLRDALTLTGGLEWACLGDGTVWLLIDGEEVVRFGPDSPQAAAYRRLFGEEESRG